MKILVETSLIYLALTTGLAVGTEVRFNRDIRPILSDRCFHCHGPDEHDRQAELRLDRAEGDDGAYRALDGVTAIMPGSLDHSEVWRRITANDDQVMPPSDSSKRPLTAAEKDAFRRWIESGANYSDFWAFVPPQYPTLPETTDASWKQHPIDRLVRHRLEAEGLAPKPPADRRTLIRRLSLDLTGLPPTRDELRAFLDDDSDDAYERVVDRLLAKPQYGEHMAKYWLDLVRFADTNGIHHDHYRDMTPYRDWVIRAFNENLPYDDFATYQLAGDLYPEPTRDQLIASGFNRLHLIIDRGTALPEESYTRNVIDRVTAVGAAYLGLTVQCAVCHDHKYDPITTKAFYRLFAFFNNLDGEPETGGRSGADFARGLQPPYVSLASAAQKARLDELNESVRRARKQVDKLQALRDEESAGGDKDSIASKLKQAEEELQLAQKEQRAFEQALPAAMVMKERAEIRPAHVLIRGAYDNPGEQVGRGTPEFLPTMEAAGEIRTRMDLARWFFLPSHPLTARVAVNRFWQQLFGVGIVKTSEDFGAQGEWPSHPEVLDYLAVSFIESGWDVKALLRQIVLSQTYRQSSEATVEEYQRDPENRLMARGSRFRLDSEVIRDQLLATSGLLNSRLYGKSVKPPQPAGLWKAVSMPSSYPRVYEPDKGEKIYRRSIYTFWKRGMPPPQMTILNAPTREACIARRERTNTPLQALLLLNEPEYLKAARHLALETLRDSALTSEERVEIIYETITSQLPDAAAKGELLAMVKDLLAMYGENAILAAQLCEGVELHEHISAAELSAWTMLTSAVYNLDTVRTRG